MASEIWLLGKIKPSWDTETLPTNSDVIGTVYALQTKKCSFSESVIHASREVERQWTKFKLEKMARKNIVRKLEKLVGEYKQLRKCAHQDSEKAVRKRIIFKAKLEQLFDVSVQATETSIKDHKIFRFWMDQKSNRILTASIVNLTDGNRSFLDLWR
jgi:ribosomal protein L23